MKNLIKELLAQGVTPEQAETLLTEFLKNGYVAKQKHTELETAKAELDNQLKERDKQLDDLKKSAGDKDALEQKIKDLQTANKQAKEQYDQKIKDLRTDTAIKLAINAIAQDTDIVASLIDKTKLNIGEDGTVTGLDEQIKTLQKDKAFLFKQDGSQGNYTPQGGKPPVTNPFEEKTFNLTEQGRLFRENPEQARALAQAAGVTI